MIHSHLNYGIEIYANTYNSLLEPLMKINNDILGILQNKTLQTPIADFYRKFNYFQIPQLWEYNILFLVHGFFFNSKHLSKIYHHYFTFNTEIHSHNTNKSSIITLKINAKYKKHKMKHDVNE